MTEKKLKYMHYYRRFHPDTSEHLNIMKQYYQALFSDRLPLDKEVKILDAGCGMGYALLSLKDMGYHNIKGIDINPEQVESCLKNGLDVIVSDTIPYLKNSQEKYDAIICFDVLEHILPQDQLEFVRSIHEALNPQGQLILTIPNANSTLAGRYRYIDLTHNTSFTEYSIDLLLFSGGFQAINTCAIPSYRPVPLKWFFSRRIVRKNFWKEIFRIIFIKITRSYRRIEMIAELDWREGCSIPLSPNLLVSAKKS